MSGEKRAGIITLGAILIGSLSFYIGASSAPSVGLCLSMSTVIWGLGYLAGDTY